MNKSELRKLYSEKRKQYTEEELQWKSMQISMRFFAHFKPEEHQCIHIFLPIRGQNEIDTWPIIQRLSKNYPSLQLTIPKADLQTLQIESYLYYPGIPLHTNTWGVPEPENGQVVVPSAIDVIVLPLLTFDKQGYRVGYGKGFYDRYLARCRGDVLKIGVSLNDPVEQITDINTYDVRMNYCITPGKVWDFA